MPHNMTIVPTGRRLRASCSCGKRWTLPALTFEVEQHPGANFLVVRAGEKTAYIKAVDRSCSDARGGAQLVRAKLVGSMSVAHAAGVAKYLRTKHDHLMGALPPLAGLPSKAERQHKTAESVAMKKSQTPILKPLPSSKRAQRRMVKLQRKSTREQVRRNLRDQDRDRALNGTGVVPAAVSGLPTYESEAPPW